MNSNEDIEKLKAKGKINILGLLFAFVVIGGGAWEYHNFYAPLDDVLVVYSPVLVNSGEQVEKNKKIEIKNTEIKKVEKNEVESIKKEISENNIEDLEANKIVDRASVEEFEKYIEEISDKVKEVEKPEIRLDRVVVNEVVKEVKNEPNPVENGKIEVYDEKGEVIIEKIDEGVNGEIKKEVVSNEKSNDVTESKLEEEIFEPNVVVAEENKEASKISGESENIENLRIKDNIEENVEEVSIDNEKNAEITADYVNANVNEVIVEEKKNEEESEDKVIDLVKVNNLEIQNTKNNVAEKIDESLEKIEKIVDVIDNKSENVIDNAKELQDGTIDMMKDIVNRGGIKEN